MTHTDAFEPNERTVLPTRRLLTDGLNADRRKNKHTHGWAVLRASVDRRSRLYARFPTTSLLTFDFSLTIFRRRRCRLGELIIINGPRIYSSSVVPPGTRERDFILRSPRPPARRDLRAGSCDRETCGEPRSRLMGRRAAVVSYSCSRIPYCIIIASRHDSLPGLGLSPHNVGAVGRLAVDVCYYCCSYRLHDAYSTFVLGTDEKLTFAWFTPATVVGCCAHIKYVLLFKSVDLVTRFE